MNEEALARLEAGLRAQRERLRRERMRSRPLPPSPGLSPPNNGCAVQRPELLPLQALPECGQALPECGPIDIPHFLKR
jgi:hypothetical protein